MGNVREPFFADNGEISGIITDITIGNVNKNGFVASNIAGTISNVNMGTVGESVFNAATGISAAMFNINIGSVAGYSLYADTGDITGSISYLKSNGAIYTGGSFTGKLLNCELDCRTKAVVVINEFNAANGEILRCKLLADPSYNTVVSPTTPSKLKIAYTIHNRAFLFAGSPTPGLFCIFDTSAI